jgi:hypothetical protein
MSMPMAVPGRTVAFWVDDDYDREYASDGFSPVRGLPVPTGRDVSTGSCRFVYLVLCHCYLRPGGDAR